MDQKKNDELIDITHLIVPEEDAPYLNDDEALDLYETCYALMEQLILENPKMISEPDFEETFYDFIYEYVIDSCQFERDIFFNDDAEAEIEFIIDCAKADFFKYFMPPRSYPSSLILSEPDYEYITKQLKKVRGIPQPVQRTNEWYEFRHNLITASNAYKAFESDSVKNQLIYEKCQPLNLSIGIDEDLNDIKEIVMVNTNSTLHWGQKYEPLSVKIYEEMYETAIEDVGCIRHEKYAFLGASPDGINIDIRSPRYGRMLEIKNIVNREIDGIPKKEYWIQMQMQMEVWGLNECDFLETKFSEYVDYAAFKEDTVEDLFEDDDGVEFANVCLSKDEKQKGQIMYFHTKEGKPHYVYKPLDFIHPDDIQKWEESVLTTFQSPQYGYTFMKYIYWKLDYMSCVLVPRNRQWFEANIGELEAIWETIKRERVTGYEHRAPNKKAKKDINSISGGMDISSFCTTLSVGNKCLLQYVKVNKVDK